ncbi:hypothetical protein AG1IA_02555 [Rhizoctonia solani AG-1 IA]|uniref:Uncharacterized protein n=1 Tax=Thanatephorus cucumeris (strain AG1-IA) TaxID=983506 RepID=L8X463_THACA|nr:hypothetical protein AG1IA_02555 [Rhizoctonia solani AG-1 IA]
MTSSSRAELKLRVESLIGVKAAHVRTCSDSNNDNLPCPARPKNDISECVYALNPDHDCIMSSMQMLLGVLRRQASTGSHLGLPTFVSALDGSAKVASNGLTNDIVFKNWLHF